MACRVLGHLPLSIQYHPGIFTYTFTPNTGECATLANLTIEIIAPTVPTFNHWDPIVKVQHHCFALYFKPFSGINGTWNPATINTSSPGSFTYTLRQMPVSVQQQQQ